MMETLGPVLLLCLAILVQTSHGAERLDAKSLLRHELHRREMTSEPAMTYQYKRHAVHLAMRDLDSVLALGAHTELDVVQESVTVQGNRLVKLQEKFKGRVVPNGIITLETDQTGENLVDASGNLYRNIHLQIDSGIELSIETVRDICLRHNSDKNRNATFVHSVVTEEVRIDDDDEPHLIYLVQYLVGQVGKPERRPTCLIEASNSSIIVSWDALDNCTDCKASGTGGNLKIGKLRYGELQKCLELRRENGMCYMENKYVRVLNNDFGWDMTDDEGNTDTPVASYNCSEIDDYVNGAYSPLLDALFYGTVVGKMYEKWYDMSPLGDVMTFRVHFGSDYSNAFWNGYECSFGDGSGSYFHPLVSLDIVGHEVGHGVTEKNSGLYYYQQWGGINEAFSDMAGESSEAYLEEADWMMGYDITVGDIPPLRYFDDPTKDGRSISHADDYTEFLDPHYGSGVYNRAFYLLVHEYGIHVRHVFHAFLHANRMYWHHMSDYEHAACDVMKSAYDLGLDGSKFRKAFSEVGIEACDLEDHVLGLKNKEVYTGVKVSKAVSPTFTFTVPGQIAESMTVISSSASGDVYIILSDKRWGDVDDRAEVYAEGLHSVNMDIPVNKSMTVTITLTTDSVVPLKDVKIVAGYTCYEDYAWLDYCHGNLSTGSEEEPDSKSGEEDSSISDDTDSSGEGEDSSDQESESSEEKDSSSYEIEIPSSNMTAAGHVFNFFKSFVIVVFAQGKK